MKRFYIKQKTWIYVLTSAILIVLLASCIVNLLAIFRVANMMSQYLPLDIVSTIVMVIVGALIAWFVFFSRYELKDNALYRYIGFLKEQIKFEDIYMMRVNSQKTILLLYVKADEKDADVHDNETNLSANIIQIFIPLNKVDSFISAIKDEIKDLAFEILPDKE